MNNISYLYLISDENKSKVKVGVSTNPAKRVKQLQTGSPNYLEVVKKFPLDKKIVFKIEKECHNKLRSKYRKRGEWFHDVNIWHVNVVIEEIIESYGII